MGTVQFYDGKILFDAGAVAMHADCCCEEGPEACEHCDGGTTPTQWKVVVSGVADDECTGCDTAFNTTFYLDQTASPCTWNFVDDAPPPDDCAGEDPGCVRVTLVVGNIYIYVYLFLTRYDAGACSYTLSQMNYRHAWGAGPDCEVENLGIAYLSGGAYCDGSGATVTVTAIP